MQKVILFLCFGLFTTTLFAEQRWYFVRHFEKQAGDNPSLTAVGENRAKSLAEYFKQLPLTAIYSTEYNRTKQTVGPLAASKGLAIQSYDPRRLSDIAKLISTQSEVLVVGHSNTTPQLVRLMGGQAMDMLDSDYGQLIVVTKNEDMLESVKVLISPSTSQNKP